MWYRVGTAVFVTTALVVFAGIGVTLLSLIFTNLERITTDESTSRTMHTLVAAIAVSGVGLIGLFGVQIGIHMSTRRRSESSGDAVRAWMHTWVSVTEGSPAPSTDDPRAGEALALLREEATGPESQRFAELYEASGFLDRDISVALRGRGLSRLRAIERLAMIRHPTAIDPLVELSRLDDRAIAKISRRAVCRTMGRVILPEGRLRATFGLLLEDERLTRGEAAELLMLLRHHAQPVVAWMLDPASDARLRQAALDVVGSEHMLELADRVAPWLQARDHELRASALRAVHALQYAPPGAEEAIVDSLRSPASFVRTQAAKACLALPWTRVREPLAAAMGDPDWWVRRAAAETLARFGTDGRTALQETARSHRDRYARDMADQVLAT